MLLNLHIKNYALIEDLRLEFAPGLNVFTGETGAGKSIIIESLGLLLGERASGQTLRKGAEHCFITAEFDGTSLKGLAVFLEEQGLRENGTLIVRREIDASGRSRAFVNDRPVSLAALAAVGEFLVDVHGQHEHQSLVRPGEQRHLLDRFGGVEELREKVTDSFHGWRKLVFQRDSKQISARERDRLADLYTFQINEIDAAKLYPGEEEELERILPQLKNAGKLSELSAEAYQIMYGADGAVLEQLGRVRRLFENMESLGGTLGETAESLLNACYQIEEVAKEVAAYRDSLPDDPEKLNAALDRQALIQRLKKKYGTSVQEILAYRGSIAGELDVLLKSDENRQELEKKIGDNFAQLSRLSERLSQERKKAAERMARAVEKEFADLGMKRARFGVRVRKETEPAGEGWDVIDFLFSANPGEDMKPLKDIASGGEMSRVMLALKTVLANADRIPVLIFDEIDAGIGGPMGQTVGRKLQNLSRHRQVLCITHLPQIAAFGARNMAVRKESKGGRTFTRVTTLSAGEHLEEIARMLSGEEITAAARKHAAELVAAAQKAIQ